MPPQQSIRSRGRSGKRKCAEEDLRGYLGNAELPSISRWDSSSPYYLPKKGRRSHRNYLRVRNDPDRCIKKIQQHDSKVINAATQTYHKYHIYGKEGRPFAGKHYEHRKGEALVLPSQNFTPEAKFENTPYPNNIAQTCRWLVDRPLKTMQRAMHLAFPDTTRWWLEEANPDVNEDPNEEVFANRNLWRSYVWRFHPDELQPTWWRDVPPAESGKTEAAPQNSMVFVIQAPWILACQDMKSFSQSINLPSLPDDGVLPEVRFNSPQRVWANLHDTCKRVNCHSFALTTYHCWAFGKFSEDWSTAYVTDVKDFDAREPTVMQVLVYWVARSMGLVGTSGTDDIEKTGWTEEPPKAGPSRRNGEENAEN